MAAPLVVRKGVVVPPRALSWQAARSGGPGGQNVNKVASKVLLRVDVSAISGLGEAARRRLRTLAANRLDAAGRLMVSSQRTRDQARNLEDARDKLRRLILRALALPRPRRASRPPTASREARLRDKRRRAAAKKARARPADDA